jgi:hypothetical protein
MYLVAVAAVLMCLATPTAAFHFFLPVGHPLCFIHEASPEPETVIAHYLSGSGRGVLTVNVLGPAKEAVHHEVLKIASESNFHFQISQQGRYDVCLNWQGEGSVKSLQMEIDVVASVDQNYRQPGASSSEYLAVTQDLTPLVNHAATETTYLTARQTRFEETASNTHGRVLLFVGVNFVVMIGAGAWQVLHLRSFFKQKKLV